MVRVGALQNTAVSREDDSRVMKISICSKVPLKGTRTGKLEVHKKPVNIIDHGCSSDTTPCGFSFKHSFTPSTSASPLRERKATEKSGRGCQDTGPGSSLTPSQAAAKIGRLKSSMAEASDPGKVALEIARLYLSLFDYKSAVKNFRIAMRSFPGDENHDLDKSSYNGYPHIQYSNNNFYEENRTTTGEGTRYVSKLIQTVYSNHLSLYLLMCPCQANRRDPSNLLLCLIPKYCRNRHNNNSRR